MRSTFTCDTIQLYMDMSRVVCTATGAGLVHGVGAGLAHGLAFARDVVRDLRRRRTGEAIFGAVPCV